MRNGEASKIADAVATRKLPIQPGDMVRFLTSGRNLFVVAVTGQEHKEGAGQFICGLMSLDRKTHWADFWIDWRGYNDIWFIERPPL